MQPMLSAEEFSAMLGGDAERFSAEELSRLHRTVEVFAAFAYKAWVDGRLDRRRDCDTIAPPTTCQQKSSTPSG
jgi:hypothetical protein